MGLSKQFVALVILTILGLSMMVLYVQYAPDSPMANTVQVCASKLGVDAKDVGKQMTKIGSTVGQKMGVHMTGISAGTRVSKPSQVMSVSSDDKKLMAGESDQGVVESIAYAAGAAITSSIGYGIYWMLTQG